jgi:fumarylacetoacetate (FAA) hydrolase
LRLHSIAIATIISTTIVGSGTVSNVARSAGSACIAERRVIEKIDLGEIRTGFMRFGDRVRMQAKFADGRDGPFGVIDQQVVAAV